EAADVFLKDSDRLKSSNLLTLLEDGWEDRLKRSVYGVVAAGMGMFPILMSLNDLTGERGNAVKCLDVAVDALKFMGVPEARNFIALTTDNPTTMQSFRRQFQQKFFWVLTLACFLHSLNTVVGEICAYPLIKSIIKQANRSVTFFNGSHYWGGQLKLEAKRLNITRGLKKNCESRWYALVLLCLSVAFHRQPLSITCLREDAKKKTNGFSAVAADVIKTVLNTPNFWPLLNQLTRIAKPIVDAIGNCESRQTTLADCMLELLRCARTMSKMELEDDEDAGFLEHAKATFDRRFIKIATPIHWLALFLHPSCRKLALSGNTEDGRGKSLDFMIKTALGIAQQWRWNEDKARKLVEDIKAYNQFKSPFSGKENDAKDWWDGIPAQHAGIRALATVLHSIVPHSADVERLFSDLGGIQSPHRNGWLIETMEKAGRIRGHLSYLLFQKKEMEGKPTQRKHSHMHTRPELGIDGDLAKDLENPITWIPPLDGGGNEGDAEEDIVEKAYDELKKKIADEQELEEPMAADSTTEPLPQPSIIGGEIIDFIELDRVDRGETEAPGKEVIDVVGDGAQGSWNIKDL
ncbi:ribonuclease H-like domain-containing protein, partial [Mycena crocata]